jgi:hypothetical protein
MQAAQTVMKWLIILGVLGMIGWAIFSAKTAMNMKTITVYAGKAILRAQIAKDDAAKEKGLAGRAQIARDEAMIFVFDKDGDINYMEGPPGLEPGTPCLKGRCSNQLSYGPVVNRRDIRPLFHATTNRLPESMLL